jgi:chorismate mutase
MEDLRRRIDAIDRRLVALLNERAGCAIALGRIKQERALPIYQPAREEEVLGNIQRTNGGPLQSGALRRLFERIIDESRRIERIATDRGRETTAAGGAAPEPADPEGHQD